MSHSRTVDAFLRGVERRAAAFARLQGGDAVAAAQALEGASGEFRLQADPAGFSGWPRQFWTLLLDRTRMIGDAGHWQDACRPLADLGAGPRAALLLRLAANLSEQDAAAVLGVSESGYRTALERAAPRTAAGEIDAEAWRAMASAIEVEVRRDADATSIDGLSPARKAPAPTGAGSRAPSFRSGTWVWPATAAVVALTALALAATFLEDWRPQRSDPADIPVTVESLPAATAAPDLRLSTVDDADLALHPDFELLLEESDSAAGREPAFHAWLAAGLADEADHRPAGARAR